MTRQKWSVDLSDQLKREWNNWSSQLKTVRVPRSEQKEWVGYEL